jgi:hypothetical protein
VGNNTSKASSVLKNYIEYKTGINEAAERLSASMALYVDDGDTFIILYNPTAELKTGITDYDYDETSDDVLGLVTTRWNESYQVIEIDSIFAKSGYGPLVSQILMSRYKKEGIAMNRSPSFVSDEAKSMWKEFFDGKGSDLVNKEKIDSEFPHHKEDYLNYKFFLKKPIRLSKQVGNHKKFIGDDPYGETETAFVEFADHLLTNKMNDIYQFQ